MVPVKAPLSNVCRQVEKHGVKCIHVFFPWRIKNGNLVSYYSHLSQAFSNSLVDSESMLCSLSSLIKSLSVCSNVHVVENNITTFSELMGRKIVLIWRATWKTRVSRISIPIYYAGYLGNNLLPRLRPFLNVYIQPKVVNLEDRRLTKLRNIRLHSFCLQ